MPDEEQLAILARGVEAWNKWRQENPDRSIDFRRANLRNRQLENANLAEADLTEAELSFAKNTWKPSGARKFISSGGYLRIAGVH
ncbi:MAG: pentapeptide repeat-containing protein [bacterium]|nr:pentapeptide repeat-containing protein [bacterium]